MKPYLFLFLCIMPFCFAQNTVKIVSQKTPSKIYKTKCFKIEPSELPKITGLKDEKTEQILNAHFRKNRDRIIAYAIKKFGDCPGLQDIIYQYPSTLKSEFKVLTQNSTIVSLVQKHILLGNKGGNSWQPISQTTNFDIRKNRFLTNQEIAPKLMKNRFEMNKKIDAYFNSKFNSNQNTINYNALPSNKDLAKLHLGIKQNTIILFLDCQPESHASLKTYEIPLNP